MLNYSISINDFTEQELRLIASALHAYREVLDTAEESLVTEEDFHGWGLDLLTIASVEAKLTIWTGKTRIEHNL